MSTVNEDLRLHGYAVLRGIVDPSAVKLARARILSEWEALRRQRALGLGGGSILGHLNYSPAPDLDVFYDALSNPQVLECVANELGEDRYLHAVGGNANLPKSHYQPAHVDTVDYRYLIVNIPLGDVDEKNGSLELWPGTHRVKLSYSDVTQRKKVPSARVNTRAGDVVVRYPHVWHRGTPNKSDVPRMMLAASFGAKQNLWSPPFLQHCFLMVWLACLNLSGVLVGITPRATMRVAPDDPKKPLGFESRIYCQVIRQAGEPFTSSNFSVAKPDGVRG